MRRKVRYLRLPKVSSYLQVSAYINVTTPAMSSPTLGYCLSSLHVLRDALDVVNGKWKLLILVALRTGHHRFREIERAIPGISSKVLAKELRDLEQHLLIRRTVHEGPPVLVSYEALPHAETLEPVISALCEWGARHREQVMHGEAVAA